MPHQGIVALSISLFSLLITMSILIFNLSREKQNQSSSRDEH